MKPSRDVSSPSPTPRLARVWVRLGAVLTGLFVAFAALPAHADVPAGWSDPPAVDKLHALLLLAGIPIGLAVIISLLTLAPGLARGEGLISAPSTEPDWLGGPTHGIDALPVGAGEAAPDDTSGDAVGSLESGTGGSSGRW